MTAWFGERIVAQTLSDRRSLASLLAKPLSEGQLGRVHMIDLFSESLYSASMNLQLGATAGCTVLNPNEQLTLSSMEGHRAAVIFDLNGDDTQTCFWADFQRAAFREPIEIP